MRNRLLVVFCILSGALALSQSASAQVYGTDGGAPGAWPPQDIPKSLMAPKPYNPRDFSGVWASPDEKDDVHWLDQKGGQFGTYGPNIWFLRPPLTKWGQKHLSANHPGAFGGNSAIALGNRARLAGYNNDPLSKCDPLGWPHDFWAAINRPFEFLQTSNRVVMHIQYHNEWREIWTDGRPLPKIGDDPGEAPPTWMGYAVGHWEGNTFVVVSTGYDERTWFDRQGDPRSDHGVLVERWTRTDYNTLTLQMTLVDPKAYKEPWVGRTQIYKRQPIQIFQENCVPSEEEYFQSHQTDVALGSDRNLQGIH